MHAYYVITKESAVGKQFLLMGEAYEDSWPTDVETATHFLRYEEAVGYKNLHYPHNQHYHVEIYNRAGQ